MPTAMGFLEAAMDMRSFDERFHLKEPGLLKVIARDIRLFAYLLGIAWKNATIGRRIRKHFIACRAKGQPLYVDEALKALQAKK
jgi:hypothetical protein